MAIGALTPAGKALTDLILEVFRLNGRLLVTGDQLVAGLGLTSARWQVLGAIAYAEHPQPVSWLARSMGLHRQGVQRIVNDMKREGLVEFQPNPNHRRAHLIVLSKRGRDTFARADQLQIPWVNRLAKGIAPKDIDAAKRIALLIRERLGQE
jgi:DNA-binding MarR family transcriptional regulator